MNRTNAARWMVCATLAAGALGLGCSHFPKAEPMGPDDFPNATPPASLAGPGAASLHDVPINPDVELIDANAPELQAAMAEFTESGRAPIVRHKDRRFVRFPYGHSDPLLYCKPLRVCDLELQAGEEVLDVALGDTEMWHAQKMESGPAGLRSPHVIFKPVMDGISTNAVITTNRRVYHVGLIARADESGRNGQHYVRYASFYYPNETVTAWMDAQARREEIRAAAEAERLAAMRPEVPAPLYHGYEITGDEVPWRPRRVFDDGTRVYIEMPDAMHVTEAPALWVIDEHGEQQLVNYRLREGHYIVDKVFSLARLAVGVGRKTNEVFITRRKPGKREVVIRMKGRDPELADAR